jgi:hypothetical protein
MEAAIEEQSTEAAFGSKIEFAAAASSAPNTDVEQRVVDCYKALLEAELEFLPGVEFGNAAIALRAERKPQKDWMERLEQLDVTYAKARYWIGVVEGKKPARGVKAEKEDGPKFDWEAAVAQLQKLKDDVEILKKSKPTGEGVLVIPLAKLAKLLDCQVVTREGRTV